MGNMKVVKRLMRNDAPCQIDQLSDHNPTITSSGSSSLSKDERLLRKIN
jgi:hypothetical protein